MHKCNMMNPFKYGCVVDGEYFCARKELARQLKSFVESGQNVVIQGERRMGKTSLVRETVRRMRGWRLLYVDLLYVRTVADLCRRISEAISEMDSDSGFLEKTAKFIARLRPTLSFDGQTGGPVLSVDAAACREPDCVEVLLNMIAAHARTRKLCVVFDEFQDILDLEDGNQVLAVMRSRIQLDSRTPYVFLGSVRNRMTDIFWHPDSPFYHSAAALPVGRIDDADFKAFVAERFATGNRKLTDALWVGISSAADGIPGYVQELCEAIWSVSSPGATLDAEELSAALKLVFSREGDHYGMFVRDLTTQQLRVLVGLAELGGKGVFAGAFLAKTGVINAASVRRALTRLEKSGLIYYFEGEYRFINPFFRKWVKQLA